MTASKKRKKSLVGWTWKGWGLSFSPRNSSGESYVEITRGIYKRPQGWWNIDLLKSMNAERLNKFNDKDTVKVRITIEELGGKKPPAHKGGKE